MTTYDPLVEIMKVIDDNYPDVEYDTIGRANTILRMIRARMKKAICENGGNYIVCDIMRAFDNE